MHQEFSCLITQQLDYASQAAGRGGYLSTCLSIFILLHFLTPFFAKLSPWHIISAFHFCENVFFCSDFKWGNGVKWSTWTLISLSHFFSSPPADSVKQNGGRVLVHCQAGISRSATICLAYLMHTQRVRLDEAFDFVKQRRQVISPNLAFMGQLLQFETDVLCQGWRKGNGPNMTVLLS